ncbi:MAG TPA: vanadium-dependent haloperoxidase [Verrucomicrobiota bacterium]|nr:hypothetical protein [Verrucomicrobiales bacterium]HRI11940.1 vanadium-dependent haloperoxidase [Verrucomicrobiota bacterium]
MKSSLLFSTLLTSISVKLLSISVSADVITDWNKIAVDATKTGGLNSNLGTRVGAIEAAAVYDAVNSIRQFGTPYQYYTPPSDPASAEAAAAQAAHDVLAATFPAQVEALDARLAASLAVIPDGPEKEAGKTVGAGSAAALLALRANDGSTPNVTYPGPTSPGVGEWRPTPGAAAGTFPPGINQQWGQVKPFVLASADQFRPGPPPNVGTDPYNAALAEVGSLGRTGSTTRTEDQTHIAQFYRQDAELLVNEAARLLSTTHGLSLEENALLFVLTDIAIADARIALWDAKYTYKYWRPITALNANPDGSVTNDYASWSPLIVTPSHPSYPSGHSGNVNAGFEVLKDFFGNRQTLTLHTTTAGEPPRTIQSLSQAESENGLSRIYGGIHYSFDNQEGQVLGNKVAAYVLAHGPRAIASAITRTTELGIALYPGLSVSGNVGHPYRIDSSPRVDPPEWTLLKFITLPTSGPYLIFDRESPGNTNRFYRAVELPN